MQTSRVTTSSAGLVLKDPSTGSVRNTISATTSSVQIEKILQQNSPTGGGLVYYNPSTKLLSYGSVSLGDMGGATTYVQKFGDQGLSGKLMLSNALDATSLTSASFTAVGGAAVSKQMLVGGKITTQTGLVAKNASQAGSVEIFENPTQGNHKVTLSAPETLEQNVNVTLPSSSGTLLVSGGTGGIPNSSLNNSTISGCELGSNLQRHTLAVGSKLTLTSSTANMHYDGVEAVTHTIGLGQLQVSDIVDNDTLLKTTGLQSAAGKKIFSGKIFISNGTASTGPNSGALRVAGGAGVVGDFHAGSVSTETATITNAGITTMTSTTTTANTLRVDTVEVLQSGQGQTAPVGAVLKCQSVTDATKAKLQWVPGTISGVALGSSLHQHSLAAGHKITITNSGTNFDGSAAVAHTIGLDIFNFDDLNNVSVASPATNSSIRYDGNNWVDATDLILPGATSGKITIKAAAATTDFTLTLPSSVGTSGQVLTNQGNGVANWQEPGHTTQLEQLLNVTIASANNSHFLKWVSGTWRNVRPELADLSDAATVCTLAGTQTLTGDKSFSGTVDFSGATSATAATITTLSSANITATGTVGALTLNATNVNATSTKTTELEITGITPTVGQVAKVTGVTLNRAALSWVDGTISGVALGSNLQAHNLNVGSAKLTLTNSSVNYDGSAGVTHTLDLGAVSVNDLSDTTVFLPTQHSLLQWNGLSWANEPRLKLAGSGSGVCTIGVPMNFTDYALTLPDSDGGQNQLLKSDGAGALSWIDSTISGVSLGGTLGAHNISVGSAKLTLTNSSTNYDGSTSVIHTLDLGVVSVNDLADAAISSVANHQLLQWNGSAWVNTSDLKLGGTTSGAITIKAPATTADYTLVLPANDGDAGQNLQTDGSGNLSWANHVPLNAAHTLAVGSAKLSLTNASTVYTGQNAVVHTIDIGTLNLGDLTNVSDVNNESGRVLKYDGSSWNDEFVSLNDLTDVNTAGLVPVLNVTLSSAGAITSGQTNFTIGYSYTFTFDAGTIATIQGVAPAAEDTEATLAITSAMTQITIVSSGSLTNSYPVIDDGNPILEYDQGTSSFKVTSSPTFVGLKLTTLELGSTPTPNQFLKVNSVVGNVATLGWGGIDTSAFVTTNTTQTITGTKTFTGTVNVASLKGLSLPTLATDAANKAYVDSLASGLKWQTSVRAVSTSNITLSGEQTIDGVALVAGDFVLVAGQTTGSENGRYQVSASGWVRAGLVAGAEAASSSMFVESGNVYADTAWTCTNDKGGDIVGTHALVFTQFAPSLGNVKTTGSQSMSGPLAITDTTDSTSSTTGTFRVAGGVGIAKKLHVGTDLLVGSPGRLYVGHGSDITIGTVEPRVQISGSAAQASTVSITRYESSAQGPYLMFGKSRSDTIGTQTVVQETDNLGLIDFYGSDGSNYALGARIQVKVDGAPGTNDMPAKIRFCTSPDGSQTAESRLEVRASGQVDILTDTDSTSTTTGSLITAGGVGIAKSLFVGEESEIAGLTFGNLHTANTGWRGLRNSALSGNANFALLQHTSGTLLLNASSGSDGISFQIGNVVKMSLIPSGLLQLPNTDEVTQAGNTTGALQVAGGVGIEKKLIVNGSTIANAGVSTRNGVTTAGFVDFMDKGTHSTNFLKLIAPENFSADYTLTLSRTAGILLSNTGTENSIYVANRIVIGSGAVGTGASTVVIGHDAKDNANGYSVTIGDDCSGGLNCVSIGNLCDTSSAAVGVAIGQTCVAGTCSVTMGHKATDTHGQCFIVNNVFNTILSSAQSSSMYVGAIRSLPGDATNSKFLMYNSSTKELTHSNSYNGTLLLGHDSNITIGAVDPRLLIIGNSASNSTASFQRFTNDQWPPYFQFGKSRSATVGTHTIVQDADHLGVLDFYGSDGSDYERGVRIRVNVDGTPSNNNVPAKIVFETHSSGDNNTSAKMQIRANGQVNVMTNTESSSSTTGCLITNGGLGVAKNAFIGSLLSSGTLAVGGVQQSDLGGSTASAQVLGTNNSTSTLAVARYSANDVGSRIVLSKSRNGTIGNHTVVQNGDILGRIRFDGSTGSAFTPGAVISAIVDGTPGSNDLPTSLRLATTPDGGSDVVERVRIKPDGQVNILTTTNSTSSTTGSLITAGGAGIAKKLFVGSDLSASGTVSITSYTPVATGTAISGTSPTVQIAEINGERCTTIKIDLQGLQSHGTGKAIGLNPPMTNFGAYLTRLTVATTGQIYRAEMACIETPTGGSTNINLVANSSSIASNNDVITNGTVIITGSTHSIGRHVFSLRGANLGDLADKYLYLAAGSGSSSVSYTAGKFIIKLYGCTF